MGKPICFTDPENEGPPPSDTNPSSVFAERAATWSSIVATPRIALYAKPTDANWNDITNHKTLDAALKFAASSATLLIRLPVTMRAVSKQKGERSGE